MRTEVEELARELERWVGVIQARAAIEVMHEAAAALRAQAERVRVLEGAVGEAEVQITYLHEKFGETGSGNAVLAKLRRLIGHGETALAPTNPHQPPGARR